MIAILSTVTVAHFANSWGSLAGLAVAAIIEKPSPTTVGGFTKSLQGRLAELTRQMDAFASLSARMKEFMCTDDEDEEEEDEDELEEDEKPVIAGKGKGRAMM